MIPNGTYRTDRGSTVTVSGKYGQIVKTEFNWREELNACSECDEETP